MSGSYNHATTSKGKLRSPKSMIGLVENGGDAYETIEEMYGMIWMLATSFAPSTAFTPAELVESARQNYHLGIASSPGVQK